MTAPGMNLEFTASGAFRARVAKQPGLLEAVKYWHRDHPLSAQGLASCEMHFKGQQLGVIFRRLGNKIGLVEIYALPAEEQLFRSRLKVLLQRIALGSQEAS